VIVNYSKANTRLWY